ncbi:MAG TPA: hypothetical protein VFR67_00955 [Pilimelia sp.]|nr:hypothetical protein [Pilimelia sp.]
MTGRNDDNAGRKPATQPVARRGPETPTARRRDVRGRHLLAVGERIPHRLAGPAVESGRWR